VRTHRHLIEALMEVRRYREAADEVQRAVAAGMIIPDTLREEVRRQMGSPPAHPR
jgi:hypothetical protein